jgi:hypothetical protein
MAPAKHAQDLPKSLLPRQRREDVSVFLISGKPRLSKTRKPRYNYVPMIRQLCVCTHSKSIHNPQRRKTHPCNYPGCKCKAYRPATTSNPHAKS